MQSWMFQQSFSSCSGQCRSQQADSLAESACDVTDRSVQIWSALRPGIHLHAATCPAGLTQAAAAALPFVPGRPAQLVCISTSTSIDWHPSVCLDHGQPSMYHILLEGELEAIRADIHKDVLAVLSKPISCWQLTEMPSTQATSVLNAACALRQVVKEENQQQPWRW